MSISDSTQQNSVKSDSSYKKYLAHKSSAKQRGIEFDLTYDDWLTIWGQKLTDRGRLAGQYGMLRTRDEGGYSVGKVRIGTPKENAQEASVARRVARAQARNPSHDYRMSPPANTSWIGRHNVFKEYSEDDEENA